MSNAIITRGPYPAPIDSNANTGAGNGRQIEFGVNSMSAPTKQVPVIDRSKVDPEVLKAADGMEAMFLDYMMKTMRKTVPKNDMDLESPATEIYRSMLDSEYAQRAANRGGVGLSDQIIAYLESRRYNLSQGQGVPANHPVNSPKEKP